MGKWKRILRGVLQWSPYAVDRVEAIAGVEIKGKEKALKALAIVSEAIGLSDLHHTDPSAAAQVRRGIKLINDGVVLIQNSAGNYKHSHKKKKKT